MTKIQRVIFSISMTALWCLWMPPYLYGILGIFIVLVGSFLWGKHLPEMKLQLKEHGRWWYLFLILLIDYMLGMEFYERWHLSSKMLTVAGILGVNIELLSIVIVVAGAVAAFPSLYYLASVLHGKKNENAGFPATCQHTATDSAKQQKMENAKSQQKAEKTAWNTAERRLTGCDIAFAGILAIGLGFVLALCPWSDALPETDSAVYLYMGQALQNGKVIYQDVFDHKGLILYLINAFGIMISGGSFTGVWVLEMVNAFVTALLAFKVVKLVTNKKTAQYMAVFLMIAGLTISQLLTDGNLTEEYALPWITLGLYICLKYFIDGAYRFYEIILIGISFTIILFIRANMIAVFAAFMPLVLIQMITKKKWKDIGICIANFLLGCVIALLPILGYHIATGSVADMISYYFVFNLEYCSESAMPIWLVMWRLFRRLTLYSGMLIAAGMLFCKNKVFQMNLWFYFVSLALASMSGRAHAHYAIILLPALVIPMGMLFDALTEEDRAKNVKPYMIVAVALVIVQAGISIVTYQPAAKTEAVTYLQENTEETDNVLVLGNYCINYLESNRFYANKFFYQTPIINNSERLYLEFAKELEADKPDVILVPGDREENNEKSNNLGKVYKKLEKWCEDDVYSLEVYDSFYVYLKK